MASKKNENTFQNRIAQFESDQLKPATPVAPSKSKKTSIAPSSQNPYIQARHKVLEGYSDWRRQEIAEMEQTGNINNRYYEDFVREVATLGDSIGG